MNRGDFALAVYLATLTGFFAGHGDWISVATLVWTSTVTWAVCRMLTRKR